MSGLRILITNNALANRAGSELYVRDLATALLERGHTPIAYSRHLGEVARELRAATVPVIDDLNALAVPPDVIHGQHHLEAMTALWHFPGVPALYLCHGWAPWEEAPPRSPRILRYLAVDYTCRDRLIYEHAIPEGRVRVLLNFVDLRRFQPRSPLPPRPARALIFSNQASEFTHLPSVRAACARLGIALDVMGLAAGTAAAQPEHMLGQYDLVFAKGRAALEALAVGAAVVLCDATGVGPMVLTGELEQLRRFNFGVRTLRQPLTPDVLAREIARYDPEDAAAVARHIRAVAGREVVVDELVELYQEIITEQTSAGAPDASAEGRVAAAYLRWLAFRLEERNKLQAELDQSQADYGWLKSEVATLTTKLDQSQADRDRLKGELAILSDSITFRLRDRLLELPLLTRTYRALLRYVRRTNHAA